jgi:hypothetical protein
LPPSGRCFCCCFRAASLRACGACHIDSAGSVTEGETWHAGTASTASPPLVQCTGSTPTSSQAPDKAQGQLLESVHVQGIACLTRHCHKPPRASPTTPCCRVHLVGPSKNLVLCHYQSLMHCWPVGCQSALQPTVSVTSSDPGGVCYCNSVLMI